MGICVCVCVCLSFEWRKSLVTGGCGTLIGSGHVVFFSRKKIKLDDEITVNYLVYGYMSFD